MLQEQGGDGVEIYAVVVGTGIDYFSHVTV